MQPKDKKQQIRKSMQGIIAWLSREEKIKQSSIISSELQCMVREKNISTLAAFVPFSSEPDIVPFMQWCLHAWVTICLPHVEKRFVIIDSLEESASFSQWMISSDSLEMIEFTQIDMMLVPWVAFTLDGKRIGRGLWWYDRVISLYRKKNPLSLVVCVCFSEQLVSDLPLEKHDQLVDELIYV